MTSEFVPVDYGGRCLDRVLRAAAGALGLELADAEAARARLGVAPADRVCVVLVDGLGQHLLAERVGHAPFLRGLLADGQTLTVGFPSTTAASLGLFGTGCAAGRTGLVGYTARNPRTGALANLVSWEGADDPQVWQQEPRLLEQVARHLPVASVGPARFAGSGLTRAALAGGDYLPAEQLAQRVDVALARLRRPGLVYLYWGRLDQVGHEHGWRSPEWGDALAEADHELARLARSVPGGTRLLVTADHGMVDVDPAQLVDVSVRPELTAGVALLAGEPRAVHVYTSEPEAVCGRWSQVLGDLAEVRTGSSAIAAGWFGPVAPQVAPLIGDVVVVARGLGGIWDSRLSPALGLRGMHGSLTPAEMQVPLLSV